jgi:SAM-dependent methyltransferase
MNKRLKLSYEKMYGKNLKMDEYKEIYKYIKKDSRLLDVGCGYGIFLDKFWKAGSGIDNNIEHVKICKEKNLDVKYGKAEKIPHENNSFDCVILMQTLEHSHNPNKVFEEIYRVLKKGGLFICTTPSYMSPNAWGDITHIRPYSFYGLSSLAIDHGFKIKKIYASSMIGENNLLTKIIFRKLANSRFFPYFQYILYLVCTK